MVTSINYVKGDATQPQCTPVAGLEHQGSGPRYIVHCCNDICRWGRGFVLAVSARWPEPEREYRAAGPLPLGTIQKVKVGDGLYVVNMVGQHGVHTVDGMPPVRYRALEHCLVQVAELALAEGATVHAPRFGAGLAGGDWAMIESLIRDRLCLQGVAVTVYDLV